MELEVLIAELKKHDPNKVVKNGFVFPHSYRGSYPCLAFEPDLNTRIGYMLECAERAIGKTYAGWGGGEFTMTGITPVYIAEYGEFGEELGPRLLAYMLANIVEE
jgi:hypothetical protein